MKPEEAIEILERKKKYSERVIDNFLDYSSGEIKDAEQTIEMYDIAISALKEVQQYREIGTVEECREVVEKRSPEKCIIDSCPDHTHYKCPSCGQIELSIYKHGFPRLGRITKYCENCGQALIDNSRKGMEDAVSND